MENKIVLMEHHFEDLEDLRTRLEGLYTGPATEYQLRFPKERRAQVDTLLDQIIKEHGCTDVFFSFERYDRHQKKSH